MARHQPSETGERPLISNATILILSGFLIGLTVGKIVADDLSPYLLSCGLSGFLAFIALELAAERRIEELTNADRGYVAKRLDRHVGSRSAASYPVPIEGSLEETSHEDGSPEATHARQFYGATASAGR